MSQVGFIPASFVDVADAAPEGEAAVLRVPTVDEVLTELGLEEGSVASALERKLAERVVELATENVELKKLNRARLAKEAKKREREAKRAAAEQKKQEAAAAKAAAQKQKAGDAAAALMDSLMDDSGSDAEAASDAEAESSPSGESLLDKAKKKAGAAAEKAKKEPKPSQARMAMIVKAFDEEEDGWEAGRSVAVEPGMAVRIISSDGELWEVVVPASADREEASGWIPAGCALSTSSGGRGDWGAVQKGEAGGGEEPEPAATEPEKDKPTRKFGRGSLGGTGGLVDKAKRKAEAAAEMAAEAKKVAAEKAAEVAEATSAAATAARASASGLGGSGATDAGPGEGAQEVRGILQRDYEPSFASAIAGAAGEEVLVLKQNDGDWWTVRRLDSGEEGFMPASMIALT